MDITTLLVPALVPVLAQTKPLIAGVVLALVVQAMKQADSFTALPADNAKRIKSVATGLSFLAAVLVAFADGNLASIDWSTPVNLAVDFAFVALSSAGTWAVALKGKNLLGSKP